MTVGFIGPDDSSGEIQKLTFSGSYPRDLM